MISGNERKIDQRHLPLPVQFSALRVAREELDLARFGSCRSAEVQTSRRFAGMNSLVSRELGNEF